MDLLKLSSLPINSYFRLRALKARCISCLSPHDLKSIVDRFRWVFVLATVTLFGGQYAYSQSLEPSFVQPNEIESKTSSNVVRDISIIGLQRVSVDSVFSLLPLGIGDSLTDDMVRATIRSIFRSGNFQNVEVGLDQGILVVKVEERPSISEITIEGNKAIPTDALLEGLSDQGMAEGRVFKRATLEGMRRELVRQYSQQGRYSAVIETEIIPELRNRVSIEINVDEGKSARIERINFVGNEKFSDKELRDLMELKDRGLFNFFRPSRKYSREKLSGDLENIKDFYLNRGYIQFSVNTAQVSMGPEKDSVYVSVSIDEGEQFVVNEVKLAGDVRDQAPFIEAGYFVRPGQIFSQQLVTSNEEWIKRLLGNLGYTFAEVSGVPDIDEDNKTVAITFVVDPKKRTYVRRIEFSGNKRTKDPVLRREMRQMESALASTQAMDLSRTRLERLGFFENVKYETTPVPGSDDQIDVAFEVKEQPFGSVSASVGFSQDVGVIFGANFQQNNFMGNGTQVGIQANRSRFRTSYSLNYVNPFYTPDGVSRGFSIFFRETDFDEINVSSFSTNSWGGSVIFGYPLGETQSLRFSAGFTATDVETGPTVVQEIEATPLGSNFENPGFLRVINAEDSLSLPVDVTAFPFYDSLIDPACPGNDDPNISSNCLSNTIRDGFIDLNGDKFGVFNVSASWRESTLNRGIFATRGHSNNVSLETALPGSELEFFKLTYRSDWYFPVTRRTALRLRSELGYGDGFGGTEDLPFFEHFFAGGIGSVRGYESNTLGPRSTSARQLLPTAVVIDASGVSQTVLVSQQLDSGERVISTAPIDATPDPFGGNLQAEGSLELILPTPFGASSRSVRTSLFYDFGNVFNTNCRASQINCLGFDLSELRTSVGINLTWLSGFGPLTFSYAFPLDDQEDDEVERFQFTLGAGF